MGKMTKRKERKGNSLHLSAQTLSQTIPAISRTKSPPWVSLSWMAASWIRGKSLCLYPHSMIDDLSWCWSVCSDSSDYSVLRCKAPRTTSNDISSVNNALPHYSERLRGALAISAASCALAARWARQERTAAARLDSESDSEVLKFSYDRIGQIVLLTGHFSSLTKHKGWLSQGSPEALGNPGVFNDLRESRSHGQSISRVMGGSVGSLRLCSSLVTITEITTNCFLLFYRKVSWEAYFAYSDSECCLLSCTYCMSVWNKSG